MKTAASLRLRRAAQAFGTRIEMLAAHAHSKLAIITLEGAKEQGNPCSARIPATGTFLASLGHFQRIFAGAV